MSDNKSNDNSALPTRRNILKSVGAAGLASSGMFATAAAAGDETEQAYEDVTYNQSLIDESFEQYAQETLEVLSEVGHLGEASIDAFPTDEHVSLSEQFETGRGTTVLTTAMAGVDRNTVKTATSVDDGTLMLVVHPKEERSYAIYDDTKSKYAYDPKLVHQTEGSEIKASSALNDGYSMRSDGGIVLESGGPEIQDVSYSDCCKKDSSGNWVQGEDCLDCTSVSCRHKYGNYLKVKTSCPTRWTCIDYNECRCIDTGPSDPA